MLRKVAKSACVFVNGWTMDTTRRCDSCGYQGESTAWLEVIRLVDDANPKGLIGLFTGDVEQIKCPRCGRVQRESPSVTVLFGDRKELLACAGDPNSSRHKEMVEGAYKIISGRIPELALHEFAGMTELKRAVADRLRAQITNLAALLQAAITVQGLVQFIGEHRAALTARWFVTAFLACMGGIPGLKIGVDQPDADEDEVRDHLLGRLSYAQALAWMAIGTPWLEGHESPPVLETELQKYVDPGVSLKEAVKLFDAAVDAGRAASDGNIIAHYCLEAIQASVHAAAGIPNPNARAWAAHWFNFELALRSRAAEIPTAMTALRISPERARRTLSDEKVWDNYIARLADTTLEWQQILYDVVEASGHATILTLLNEGRRLEDPAGELTVDGYLSVLAEAAQSSGTTQGMIVAARPYADLLVRRREAEALERLCDGLISLLGGGDDARAAAESLLGSCLKRMGMPRRFLERVGATARDWEQALKGELKVTLWTERANALRLSGRFNEALEIAGQIIEELPPDLSPHNRRVAQMNAAILLREVGSPDVALGILQDLAAASPAVERIPVLMSLAATYSALGRSAAALHTIEDAHALAKGPLQMWAARLQVYRTAHLVQTGEYEKARAALLELSLTAESDPDEIMAEASAWANLMVNNNVPESESEPRLRSVVAKLKSVKMKAEETGNIPQELGAMRLMAEIGELLALENAEIMWRDVLTTVEEHGQSADLAELIHLAIHAYRRGEREEARAFLRAVPRTLTATFGGVQDIAVAVASTGRLGTALDQIIRMMLNQPTAWEDLRLAAELQRDTIGRCRRLRTETGAPEWDATLEQGLADDALSCMRPVAGAVAVVEWIHDREHIAGFITRIDWQGQVASDWLRNMPIDARHTARRLHTRLQNWTLSLNGDPLDLAEWKHFEIWMAAQLAKHLDDGDHVIFIEHRDFVGLPWHVASSPRWTASYETGWTALLRRAAQRMKRERVDNEAPTFGLMCVPRFNEGGRVAKAFETSIARTKAAAAARGMRLATAIGNMCDQDAVTRILSASSIAKMLCHGFVNPADNEVALIISHAGSLPAPDSVAGASELGRRHRLSWRDMQALETAADFVYTIACSSGSSQVVGLGERLGLLGGLRRAGTRAVIAPRWDVFPEVVLPILDDAIDQHLAGVSPAKALAAASTAAIAAGAPRWLGLALALEGDWQ